MDAPVPSVFFGFGFAGRDCSHTFGLDGRHIVAGPDEICWLMPNHLYGPSMSHALTRLNQPRSDLLCHHLEKACAIRGVCVALKVNCAVRGPRLRSTRGLNGRCSGRSCLVKWLLDTSTLARLMPLKAGASIPLFVPWRIEIRVSVSIPRCHRRVESTIANCSRLTP